MILSHEQILSLILESPNAHKSDSPAKAPKGENGGGISPTNRFCNSHGKICKN